MFLCVGPDERARRGCAGRRCASAEAWSMAEPGPGNCSPDHPSQQKPHSASLRGLRKGPGMGTTWVTGAAEAPPPRLLIWSLFHTTYLVNSDAQGLLSPLRLPSPSVSQGNGASPSSRAGSDEGLCLKGQRGGTSARQVSGKDGSCCSGDALPGDAGQGVREGTHPGVWHVKLWSLYPSYVSGLSREINTDFKKKDRFL